MQTKRILRSITALLILALTALASTASTDETAEMQQYMALTKVLPQSKLTLADGIRRAAEAGEAPISAKFEFDDAGKLSLSVYTAAKGLQVDPEHNVLKELSGGPDQPTWNPETEVFKDVPHVARASEQLSLMRISRVTLAEVVNKAEKANRGTVFSITPLVEDRRPVFDVLTASRDGKVTELHYSAMDGRLLAPEK